MEINITAGECLNKILKEKYKDKIFIPFNEAMINGSYNSILFSDDFIKERSIFHKVSIEEYKEKLKDFLNLLNNLNIYDCINLYFGDEPFCNANKKVVIETLKLYGYKKSIILYTTNEETGEILDSIKVK